MNTNVERVLRIAAALAAAAALFSAVGLAYLAYPGTPSHSDYVNFEGFIKLPKSGALNVLDYLTLRGHTLYVTGESSGSLFKIDLDPAHPANGAVAEMSGGGGTHGVALLRDSDVAFITRSGENTVDVFDRISLHRLGRIPVADDADAILYDPAVQLVYVANGDAKLATLIDPVRRETVGTILFAGKPEFAGLDSKTGLLYQNLQDIHSVAAIDLSRRAVVGQWSLAPCEDPSGMTIDSGQRRLYAVCSGNAILVVFDLDTHRVITSLKIGGGPDSVALDGTLHRIYCAGRSGRLTVIQQDGLNSYRVMDEIRTHYGAHTLAVDPILHTVYVAYASLFTNPRIAVFSAKVSK